MLLQDFEELFDGTLGDWDTEPVDFELKEDAKPHYARYYPMARIHTKRLLKLR